MNKLIFIFLIFLPISSILSQTSWMNNKHYVVEDTSKYTYSMIVDDLMYLYANFPSWVHPVSVGKSEFGLEMSTIRLGYDLPKKKSVFLARDPLIYISACLGDILKNNPPVWVIFFVSKLNLHILGWDLNVLKLGGSFFFFVYLYDFKNNFFRFFSAFSSSIL